MALFWLLKFPVSVLSLLSFLSLSGTGVEIVVVVQEEEKEK